MNMTALASAIFAASILVIVTPAYAQDDQPFNGPWVGATAGYDTFSSGGDEDDSSEDGIAYGIALGYDVNLGNVVVGVEAELSDSSVSASAADVLETGDLLTLSAGRDIYAGVRVGVPVTESLMVYAKGGYSNQRFTATYSMDDLVEAESGNTDGWRVGGGIEYDLGQPFARLEYRYSDYGSFSDTDFETSRHQVMLTAGLRF
ncbi:porin family protein [Erythrobacter alti]|uniref:outer membrane protein n=1 Tax=Erythrobacter alti TaxID=1896145 RepID=UPI0030F3ABA1